MKINLIFICITLVAFVGCNKTQAPISEIQTKNEQASIKHTLKSEVIPKKSEALHKSVVNNSLPQSKKSTVIINDATFKLISGELKKNTKVLNLNMNEYGRIKGSFVIVLAKNKFLTISHFDKVIKVANQTYRIWPPKEKELLSYYKELTANSDYITVEMDIDYSASSKQETQ